MKAIEEGLESGDLAELQGLLISGLTMQGTRFSEEDMPLLFDALLEVDDYGLQKLVLTHLERVEGQPEELVGGYLDYLENSRRPLHSEDVFKKLVQMGGDDVLQGVSDIFAHTESPGLQRQALEALSNLKDPRSVPVIQDVLRREEDPQKVGNYLQSLGRIGGADAVASIVDYAIRESHPSAYRALREVTDVEAAPVISRELSLRAPVEYQRDALRALSRLGNPRTIPDISRYLDGAQGRMALEALSALGRFRDPQASRALEHYASRQTEPRMAQLAMRYAQRVQSNIQREREQGRDGNSR